MDNKTTPTYANLYSRAEEETTAPEAGYTISGLKPLINERYEQLVKMVYGDANAWIDPNAPDAIMMDFFERKKKNLRATKRL